MLAPAAHAGTASDQLAQLFGLVVHAHKALQRGQLQQFVPEDAHFGPAREGVNALRAGGRARRGAGPGGGPRGRLGVVPVVPGLRLVVPFFHDAFCAIFCGVAFVRVSAMGGQQRLADLGPWHSQLVRSLAIQQLGAQVLGQAQLVADVVGRVFGLDVWRGLRQWQLGRSQRRRRGLAADQGGAVLVHQVAGDGRIAGDPPRLPAAWWWHPRDDVLRTARVRLPAVGARCGRVFQPHGGRVLRAQLADLQAIQGGRALARAAQQVAQRAVVHLAAAAVARRERRHAQPHRVARARQRHVQQAQVFALLLQLGKRLVVVVAHIQVHAARAGLVFGRQHHGVVRLAPAPTADERQQHQRVLQALGLVDGDHLDQVVVAFQAQARAVLPLAGVLDLLRQLAHQRLWAVQLLGLRLQPLGQVQQVGQRARTAGQREPGRWQREVVQQLAHHGQHALLAPQRAVAAKAQHHLVPQQLVVVQALQPGVAAAHAGRAQGGTQAAGLRVAVHGFEPDRQILRLGRLEHRLALGQVGAGDAACGQGLADRVGLFAVAHQHGHVARAQWRHRPAGLQKTGVAARAGAQPVGHLRGADLGHVAAVARHAHGVLPAFGGQPPPGQRRGLAPVQQQLLGAALGRHGQEGHGVVGLPVHETVGKAKRRLGPIRFGVVEHRVDRADQRLGRAEVGAQRVMPPRRGAPRLQVGVDVGAAKAVNGLLGVANQEQAAGVVWLTGCISIQAYRQFLFAADAIHRIEHGPLDGVGVLKLVDHGHRELAADALGQHRAVARREGRVQAAQHVVKAQLGAAQLFSGQRAADVPGGVRHQLRLETRQIGMGVLAIGHSQPGVDGHEGRVRRGADAFELDFLEPKVLDVLAPALGQGRVAAFAPAPQVQQPGVEHPVGLGVTPAIEHRQPLAELRLQRIDAGRPGGARLVLQALGMLGLAADLHQLRHGRFGRVQQLVAKGPGCALLAQQRAHRGHQRFGVTQLDAREHRRLRASQPIELLAPVVLRGLQLQLGFVGQQGLCEQVAAVEGVLAQHAVAPAVDGGDGGLVHPVGRHAQQLGAAGPVAGRKVIAQREQVGRRAEIRLQRVAGLLGHTGLEHVGGFAQALADAVAQLVGGCVGEGHDQDLGRRQRAGKGGGLHTAVHLALGTVAQHQAQVQLGDGVGLAGAGTGFDQPRARQRQAQRVQRLHGRWRVAG